MELSNETHKMHFLTQMSKIVIEFTLSILYKNMYLIISLNSD